MEVCSLTVRHGNMAGERERDLLPRQSNPDGLSSSSSLTVEIPPWDSLCPKQVTRAASILPQPQVVAPPLMRKRGPFVPTLLSATLGGSS